MIIIDIEKCEGCGDCAAACPMDCIWMESVQGKIQAFYEIDDCVQCGVCKSVCPNGAITLVET